MWLHVDDYFLHGPTFAKVAAGLIYIIDEMVLLGLVCQKKKTAPPSQFVKLCGFNYDTRAIPALCIPDDKVSKATSPRLILAQSVNSTSSGGITLYVSLRRQSRTVDMETLAVTWGDGSGSGTGGTFNYVTCEGPSVLQTWLGVWKPVFHHFTSNWREICTLKLSGEFAPFWPFC